jgi:hypothetical protein
MFSGVVLYTEATKMFFLGVMEYNDENCSIKVKSPNHLSS